MSGAGIICNRFKTVIAILALKLSGNHNIWLCSASAQLVTSRPARGSAKRSDGLRALRCRLQASSTTSTASAPPMSRGRHYPLRALPPPPRWGMGLAATPSGVIYVFGGFSNEKNSKWIRKGEGGGGR